MVSLEDKIPKVPIGAENLVKFYLYLWPQDRTQIEVSRALKIEGPAIRTTAKILKEHGLLERKFSEEHSPNILLSVPIEDIIKKLCIIWGEDSSEEIIAFALKDRKNFEKINIAKVVILDKTSLNWKIAKVLYKESASFLFREILSYGKIAREEKVFSRFLNRIAVKTMFSQDVMESIIKKEVLSDQYQEYQLPKFKVVFTKSNHKKTR